MNAAEALQTARAVGVDVVIDGDDLILEASVPPPDDVVRLLTINKPGIVALLQQRDDAWSMEDWQAFFDERAGIAEYDGGQNRQEAEATAFECCITQWLNLHPTNSDPDYWAWCQQPDTAQHAVVPFNANNLQHTWLHPECWQSWYGERRRQAQTSLRSMGLVRDKPRSKDKMVTSETS